ncbi:MAG: hypothetical protein HQ582_29615 [Planctomycetes bacterium]|nr:hypothetical protein [Planctomycetota bacterium]
MSRSNDLARVWVVLCVVSAVAVFVGCPSETPDASGPPPGPSVVEPISEETPSGEPAEAVEMPAVEEAAEAEKPAEAAPAEVAAGTTKSELLVKLPTDVCNTADAMCLLPNGNVILSVPNFNDLSQPSLFMKITPENEAQVFMELPNHPTTEKPMGPLGICVAPNGDLFFADFQQEGERQSRVMRVVMKDGEPQEIVPVIEGFTVSNAVICRDGFLYVSETQIDPEAKPAVSGVFRFNLEDLKDAVVELATPVTDDPHLIGTIETFDEELPLGADGLAFDEDGNLYIGNFSDGTVHRFQFDAEGKVTTNEIFAKADFMKSADGLFFDPVTKKIYVADSKANAVQVVSLDGSVTTLAQNGVSDGTDGGMDQPCEVLVRAGEVIVSNMDWPVPGCINTEYDKPCTLAVIKLDE